MDDAGFNVTDRLCISSGFNVISLFEIVTSNGFTLILQVATCSELDSFTEMVACPLAIAVTKPLSSTVAMFSFDEEKIYVAVAVGLSRLIFSW